MTRKSLSDLVRMEAEKPVDDLPLDKSETSEEIESINQNEINKVELDAISAKLKDVLEDAKRKEDALVGEIAKLKEELKDQKHLVTALKSELGQTDKLKKDFAEAKAVIMKLTATNQVTHQAQSDRTYYPPMTQHNSESDIGSWLG